MAYGSKSGMGYSTKDSLELRPRTATGVKTKDRLGSTKGDVGTSPRASQPPSNHGDFVTSIGRKNGVSFKGGGGKSGGYV